MADTMKTVAFHTLTIERGKSFHVKVASAGVEEPVLQFDIGTTCPSRPPAIIETGADSLTIKWGDNIQLEINHQERDGGAHRYDFKWNVKNKSIGNLTDTFSLGTTHWYGGAQVKKQMWPIQRCQLGVSAYVTGDSFKEGQYGGVMERYFLSSTGMALFISDTVPLFLGLNKGGNNTLTVTSKWASPYLNTTPNGPLFLNYTLFQCQDVKAAHLLTAAEMIDKPSGIPDELIFKHPIWSTWAMYKKNINQEIVLKFAEDITKNGFSASQVEIDDDWTSTYGDMEFNPSKFPDPKGMVKQLKDQGHRVTVWIHPFCTPFSNASSAGNFWVRSAYVPGGLTIWWNGVGKILDVTNPEAVEFFKCSLQALQSKYGIASFKFDAGETNWLPPAFRLARDLSNPNEYSKLYAEMAYDLDTSLRAQEIRVGHRTQSLPLFVRMMDKDSNWGWNNGLKTLIPHALTFGLLGYPFVLPDMIGGNAYPVSAYPERELFVRWLQVNVFMPSLQFSIVPWHYDEEVLEICRKMTKLHEDFADTIIELARESTQTGAPINRPLWWVAPNDEVALALDSEFLLGDNLLVAPVLHKGAVKRDIYLPAGTWLDELRGGNLEGGKWYLDYSAELHELPHFSRVS